MEASNLITAIYARVSDRGRQGDNFSIPSQLQRMREHCREQGWQVCAELSEEGSAYLQGLERSELQKALEMARTGRIKAVMFFSPDRFTRDLGDGVILRRQLYKLGVKLYCFYPHFHEVTSDMEILHIITDYQSQQYVEKLREASMRGYGAKIDMGLFPQGNPPYGYRLVGKKKESHLEVDTDEAQVVVWIFEWYCYHHLSRDEIARKLNEMGIPSNPTGKDNVWNKTKVIRILGNETYAGIWYAYTWKTLGKKKVKRDEDERKPIRVPAIISRSLWEATAERRRTRKQGRKSEYCLMSCRVRCVCGISMAGVQMRNREEMYHYQYYRCTSHQTPRGPCGAKQWRVDHVDATVWQFAYEFLHDPQKLLEGYRQFQQSQEKDQELYSHQIGVLAEQVVEQKRVLTEMIEQRANAKSRSVQAILDSQIEEHGSAIDTLEARQQALIETQQTTLINDIELTAIKEEIEAVRQMIDALETINEEADVEAKRALIELLNLRATLRTDDKDKRWVDIRWIYGTDSRTLYVQK